MRAFLPELYAAYGSNLSHDQMRRRGPDARVAGSLVLAGWRLVVRKYALIERDDAASCPVGLWQVTAACLESLDRYEGPRAYRRVQVPLPDGGVACTYTEIRIRPGPPAVEYVQRLRRGYADFGFDTAVLDAAIIESGFSGAVPPPP
jgi:hypothetical protein